MFYYIIILLHYIFFIIRKPNHSSMKSLQLITLSN